MATKNPVTYNTEEEAAADGFTFDHDADGHMFTLLHDDKVMGTAHYSLYGSEDAGIINFDGTQVHPDHRGTGLSALLAHRALSDDVVEGRNIQTSCWYMEGYLDQHPELRRN